MKPKLAFHFFIANVAVVLFALGTAKADDASKHGPIAWLESLPKAQQVAAKDKKIILLDFWAEWCGPCKKMLATTYKDPKVVEKSKSFVPVLVDLDKQKELSQRYGVSVIPTVLFLDSKGNVLEKSEGYMDAGNFLKLMEKIQKKMKA